MKLYDWIQREYIDRGLNFLAAIIGKTGTGKSWTALKIAYDMSMRNKVPFSVDHVIYTSNELVRLANSLSPNSFIILDEVIYDFDARRFMTEVNRCVAEILTTYRHKHLHLIMCTPILSAIDLRGRQLLRDSIYIKIDRPSSEDIKNHVRRGDVFKVYIKDELKGLVKAYKWKKIVVSPPPPEITEPYEARMVKVKDEFMRKLMRRHEGWEGEGGEGEARSRLEGDEWEGGEGEEANGYRLLPPTEIAEKLLAKYDPKDLQDEYGNFDVNKIMKTCKIGVVKAYHVRKELTRMYKKILEENNQNDNGEKET